MWSIFVNAVTGVNANYLTTVVAIEETHQVSLAEAKANFEQAMIPATVTYVNQTESHREQFQQAVDSSSQNWGSFNVTRKPREWIADQVRGFLQWETKIAEDATSYLTSNNPYAVGTVSFFGNLQQNAAGIGLSFVESEKTAERIFVDGGEAIDVGKEHGVAVGIDHVIGLRQFAEAGYGVDIMTLDKVDPLDKIADGSGRFGSTAGMFAGISSSIRLWLNPQPVSVTTAVTETMQKNMKTNVASEIVQNSFNAPANVNIKKWFSTDPYVAETANIIDNVFPNKVKGVNIEIKNITTGKKVTDFDILLDDAVIQVKSGSAGRIVGQIQGKTPEGLKISGYDNHRTFGFAPEQTDAYIKVQQYNGLSITNNIYELLQWIGQ